jgi:hypothetical protein
MQKEFLFENFLGLDGVVVKLETDGQMAPDQGDDVRVKATIALPVDADFLLAPRYRFGTRCRIWYRYLNDHWGEFTDKFVVHDATVECRIMTNHFHASTYREAFVTAKQDVVKELTELVTMMDERKRKLRDAEVSLQDMDVIPRQTSRTG